MTLYVSRLRLDPRNRAAATNLSRPYELHRTLLRAFPSAHQGGPGRVLFRSEPLPQARTAGVAVLVQSDTKPDWIQAAEAFPRGLLLEPPEFRELPTTFAVGTVLRFRLRANPTRRRSTLSDGTRDERRNRPRHAYYREQDQLAWLLRQGATRGFQCVALNGSDQADAGTSSTQYDVVISNEGTILTGKRTKEGVTRHHSVLYEGHLRVTDTSSFRKALHEGIGPGKAFGFGLLSIAPVRP